MKRRLYSIYRSVAATMLLLLFVGYYADVNLFVHSHIINGVTIVHSHVHRGNHQDTPDGNHSTSQINLIASLSAQLLTTDAIFSAAFEADYQLLTTLCCDWSQHTQAAHISGFSLRAPPVV